MSKEKLKEVGYSAIKIIGPVSEIVTIIGLFIVKDTLFYRIICIIVCLYILATITYIVKKYFDFEKINLKKNMKVASKLHNYNHELRNYSSSAYFDGQCNIGEWIITTSKLLCSIIAELFNEILKKYLGENDVSVCLKLIKPQNVFDSNFQEWEMDTIARSANTLQDRNSIDSRSVKISENTDFQVIISDKYKDRFISFPDMTNIYDDFRAIYNLEYKNSRGQEFSDFYKSTIIVPVSIEGKSAAHEIQDKMQNSKEQNFIVAFLCIDSMKIFATEKEKDAFKNATEYAKSIGDSLYIFFEKVLLYKLNSGISKLENEKLEGNESVGDNQKAQLKTQKK